MNFITRVYESHLNRFYTEDIQTYLETGDDHLLVAYPEGRIVEYSMKTQYIKEIYYNNISDLYIIVKNLKFDQYDKLFIPIIETRAISTDQIYQKMYYNIVYLIKLLVYRVDHFIVFFPRIILDNETLFEKTYRIKMIQNSSLYLLLHCQELNKRLRYYQKYLYDYNQHIDKLKIVGSNCIDNNELSDRLWQHTCLHLNIICIYEIQIILLYMLIKFILCILIVFKS